MISLIINTKILELLEITSLEFLYLYYIYTNENFGVTFNDIDNEELQKKKLIKISRTNEIILRQKSIDLIELSLVEVDISLNENKKKIKNS